VVFLKALGEIVSKGNPGDHRIDSSEIQKTFGKIMLDRVTGQRPVEAFKCEE